MTVHFVASRAHIRAPPERIIERVCKNFTVPLEKIKDRENTEDKVRKARAAAMLLLGRAGRLDNGRIQDILICSKSETDAAGALEKKDKHFQLQVAILYDELTSEDTVILGLPSEQKVLQVPKPAREPMEVRVRVVPSEYTSSSIQETPPRMWRGRLLYDRRPKEEQRIFLAIQESLGVRCEDIRGDSHSSQLVDARKIFVLLAHTYLSMTHEAVADALAKGRSYTRVRYEVPFMLASRKKVSLCLKLDMVCRKLDIDSQDLFTRKFS